MSDDFVSMGEFGIAVRDARGGFQPIQTPDGFTTLAFRNAVAATYTAFMTLGKLPSVTEVYKIWPKIPVKTYSALFLTEEFKQALQYRGVEWDSDSGLSMEQSMAIIKMSDPYDRRSIGVKLREMGIPPARWHAWQKHPLFAAAYKARAEDVLSEAVNPTLIQLAGAASSGDLQASKLLLEITGRWNPSQQQTEDARIVVMTVIEAVIAEVADPEVRKAILSKVHGAVVGFDAVNHRSLEG